MTSKGEVFQSVDKGRFRIEKRIGGGSFGEVYKGIEVATNEVFAIKTEPVNAKVPQLAYEYKLFRHLSGGQGIPAVKYFGEEGEVMAMVMEMLGPSLENFISQRPGKKFSLKTTLMLADQLIVRLDYLHSKDHIHRDIKPENFLMGGSAAAKTVLFLIDLGLARRYRDAQTHVHIPFREKRGMTGTVRYTSVGSHLGYEQSRKDDLESAGYIFVYFLKGTLPWQGLKVASREGKYKMICDMKAGIPPEKLCEGLPAEFATYVKYIQSLRFQSKPDYFYIRKLLRALLIKSGFKLDFVYDWDQPNDTAGTKKDGDGRDADTDSDDTKENNAGSVASSGKEEADIAPSRASPPPKGAATEKK